MQATITYELTEQAQRAAMMATGQSIARYQEMVIEVEPQDLELFPVDKKGEIKLSLDGFHPPQAWAGPLHAAGWAAVHHNGTGLEATVINPPLIEDYKRGAVIVAEQDAAEAELKRQNGEHNLQVTEVAYQVFLQNPDARADSARTLVGEDNLRTPADWWPADHTALAAEIKRREELDAAARRAKLKAEEAAKEAKEAAKLKYIDAFVAECGGSLAEQHKAGLLARSEVVRMIADAVFEEFGLPDHHALTTCQDEACPCGTVSVDAIPPATYAAWLPIAKLLPEGATADFEKTRDCVRDEDGELEPGNDGAGKPYYTAFVRLTVGPFVFKRRIKIA